MCQKEKTRLSSRYKTTVNSINKFLKFKYKSEYRIEKEGRTFLLFKDKLLVLTTKSKEEIEEKINGIVQLSTGSNR